MHSVLVLHYYIIQGFDGALLTVDSIVIFSLLKESGHYFSVQLSAISYYY
jgi:hypothetical protein